MARLGTLRLLNPMRFVAYLCLVAVTILMPSAAAHAGYSFHVIAKIGTSVDSFGTLTSLGWGPSINDLGEVAFTGCDTASCAFTGREGVFVERHGTITDRVSLIDQLTVQPGTNITQLARHFGFGSVVQLNNADEVIWRARGRDGLFSFILRMGTTAGSVRIVANTDHSPQFVGPFIAPFDLSLGFVPADGLRAGVTLSNADLVTSISRSVFSGILPSGLTVLATPLDTEHGGHASIDDYARSSARGLFPDFYPMVSDYGDTIVRGGATASAPLALFLNGAFSSAFFIAAVGDEPSAIKDHFLAIGQKPGISDDGTVVAFMGHQAASGVGIYVSYMLQVPGGYTYAEPIKIAGLGDLTSFSLTPRVGVNHSHGIGAEFTVAFLATSPAATPGQPDPIGLYTVDVDLADPAHPIATAPRRVVAVGDQIPGLEGTILDIATYDPVNNFGQLAFSVRTSQSFAIVRAAESAPLVVNVVTHGFNPTAPILGEPLLGTWEDFRSGWRTLATRLDAVPEIGSVLSGRVETYVSEWESTEDFRPAFFALLVGEIEHAAAKAATRNGQPVLAATFEIRAAILKAFARRAALKAREHAVSAASAIVADVTSRLLLPDPAASRAHEQRVHLIGHSRGAAVNALVSKSLTEAGYDVDQYTALDGFGTDWPKDADSIGDLDIPAIASVSPAPGTRKVNYRVESDLADVILEMTAGPSPQSSIEKLRTALLTWLSRKRSTPLALISFVLEPDVRSELDLLDLRAPGRIGFDDQLIAGVPTPVPDCTSASAADLLDGTSNHLNVMQLYACTGDYLLDNFVGRNRSAQTLPPFPNAVGTLGARASATVAAIALPSNFVDGGFDVVREVQTQADAVDAGSTELSVRNLMFELVSDPVEILASEWTIGGDVRPVVEDENVLVQLTQAPDTKLGQMLSLRPDAATLSFDLDVIDPGVQGATLQISLDATTVAMVPLEPSTQRHHAVPIGAYSGKTGHWLFTLTGPQPSSATVRLDNIRIANQGDPRKDLAITKIVVPRKVTLKAEGTAVTNSVTVHVQNQSPQSDRVEDLNALTSLVELELRPLAATACATPKARLAAKQKTLPVTLKAKQSVAVKFDVTFECAVDPAASSKKAQGHEDYTYVARLHHTAVDGQEDEDPVDDICPRTVDAPFRLDPNPNGKLKDKGCGSKKADKTFGGAVVTDVVVKH